MMVVHALLSGQEDAGDGQEELSKSGSVSWAKIAKSHEPVRSRVWRSFSKILSKHLASALFGSSMFVCLFFFF